jgi:flagellar biosynthesis/type III secretory pathway protein FliH
VSFDKKSARNALKSWMRESAFDMSRHLESALAEIERLQTETAQFAFDAGTRYGEAQGVIVRKNAALEAAAMAMLAEVGVGLPYVREHRLSQAADAARAEARK